MKAENQLFREQFKSAMAYLEELQEKFEQMERETEWISLPCAPERLPMKDDIVVERNGVEYIMTRWCDGDKMIKSTTEFKIIERAK